MGFKVRGPSFKLFGSRIRKTKNGWTMSSKTLLGGRKTINLKTGKTTKTYKSIIPGRSTQIISTPEGKTEVKKKYRSPEITLLGARIRKTKNGVSISGKNLFGGTSTVNTGSGVVTKTYKTGIPGVSYQSNKRLNDRRNDNNS